MSAERRRWTPGAWWCAIAVPSLSLVHQYGGWRGGLVSAAHTPEDIKLTIDAWRKTLRALRDEGELV